MLFIFSSFSWNKNKENKQEKNDKRGKPALNEPGKKVNYHFLYRFIVESEERLITVKGFALPFQEIFGQKSGTIFSFFLVSE